MMAAVRVWTGAGDCKKRIAAAATAKISSDFIFLKIHHLGDSATGAKAHRC